MLSSSRLPVSLIALFVSLAILLTVKVGRAKSRQSLRKMILKPTTDL